MSYYHRSKKSKRNRPELPGFLLDMPAEAAAFVEHCRSRLPHGCDIGHIETMGDNTFEVSSFSCDTDFYQVTLGSDDSPPRCDCPDMSSTNWPCKHMLAVLMHHEDGDWTDIPEKYRLDPMLMKVVPIEEQLAKELRDKLQYVIYLSRRSQPADTLRKAIRAVQKVSVSMSAQSSSP